MSSELKIKKIIHLIWFDDFSTCHHNVEENVKVWRNLNDDFHVMLWDYEDTDLFIKNKYPDYYERWLNIPEVDCQFPKIKKHDCARYFILNYFGGCYFDIDIYPIRPIKSLLNDKKIYGHKLNRFDKLRETDFAFNIRESNLINKDIILVKEALNMDHLGKSVANGWIMSNSDLPIWLNLAEYCFYNQNENVLNSFGTHAFAKFIRANISYFKEASAILPCYYGLWKESIYGPIDQFPFVFSYHAGDLSWGNHNLEKPWTA